MGIPWWQKSERWILGYGAYEGVEAFALRELQRVIQYQLPYVLPAVPATSEMPVGDHWILVGTVQNNPRLADLAGRGVVNIPPQAGGFTVQSLPSPWHEGRKLLVVAGHDPAGVLYGVEEFGARYPHEFFPALGDPVHRLQALNDLPSFLVSDYPRIRDRGIWTWGYVIYDYRAYLDAMARLRMNLLTIWNDQVPLNAGEVIDYAHARGIQVVFGFHWGWGVANQEEVAAQLATPAGRTGLGRDVLKRYQDQYASLRHDGIYFQSVTEHSTKNVGGRSVAAIMCDFVNETSRLLWKEFPDLSIQFGLHATSVMEHYPDLAGLDPRVIITWEDAGALPFAYDPVRDRPDMTFEQTLAYSRQLAVFRPGSCFALVPKGWSNLDWGQEFEHHGPFVLGERRPEYLVERHLRVGALLDRRDALWESAYAPAQQYYREMLACKPASMLVTGLIEDGLMELEIRPSVAMFGQMIWNPERDLQELRRLAMSPYYRRHGLRNL